MAEIVFPVIRAKAPLAKIIFHDLDLQFLREKREAEIKKDPEISAKALRTQANELAFMEQADHTVIVSPAELIHLKNIFRNHRSMSFRVSMFPWFLSQNHLTGRKDIFFLGGYAHHPNVDAVIWFVKEIWPLIHEKSSERQFFYYRQ